MRVVFEGSAHVPHLADDLKPGDRVRVVVVGVITETKAPVYNVTPMYAAQNEYATGELTATVYVESAA